MLSAMGCCDCAGRRVAQYVPKPTTPSTPVVEDVLGTIIQPASLKKALSVAADLREAQAKEFRNAVLPDGASEQMVRMLKIGNEKSAAFLELEASALRAFADNIQDGHMHYLTLRQWMALTTLEFAPSPPVPMFPVGQQAVVPGSGDS